jgi:hypothetical protein
MTSRTAVDLTTFEWTSADTVAARLPLSHLDLVGPRLAECRQFCRDLARSVRGRRQHNLLAVGHALSALASARVALQGLSFSPSLEAFLDAPDRCSPRAAVIAEMRKALLSCVERLRFVAGAEAQRTTLEEAARHLDRAMTKMRAKFLDAQRDGREPPSSIVCSLTATLTIAPSAPPSLLI